MSTQELTLDQGALRTVLGHYPTGVVIVTGIAPDGEHLAMIVGTFTSVSLDPPLVAFLPMKTSKTFQRLRECASMCINVLTGDQEDLGRIIASRWENKLDGVDWFTSPAGSPVFRDSLAWLDVTLEQSIEAGDHWIALCRIDDLAVNNPSNPLIFFQGGYGRFVTPSLVARLDTEIIGAVREAVVARSEIERLAQEIGCECSLLTAINQDEFATVASAAATGLKAEPSLGVRMPIVPPIGDSIVYALDEAARQRWLAKAKGVDEARLQVFRDRLRLLHEEGFGISYLPATGGDSAYDGMRQAVGTYAAGRLTPVVERAVREQITSSTVEYDVRAIEPGTVYDVGSIVVPVRDGNGDVTLTLRLGQLPAGADGSTVLAWIERLKQARAWVEDQLANPVAQESPR